LERQKARGVEMRGPHGFDLNIRARRVRCGLAQLGAADVSEAPGKDFAGVVRGMEV